MSYHDIELNKEVYSCFTVGIDLLEDISSNHVLHVFPYLFYNARLVDVVIAFNRGADNLILA